MGHGSHTGHLPIGDPDQRRGVLKRKRRQKERLQNTEYPGSGPHPQAHDNRREEGEPRGPFDSPECLHAVLY